MAFIIIATNFRTFTRISFIVFAIHISRKYGLLDKIKNVRRNRVKGKKGEQRVSRILKSLHLDKIVLNDMNLEFDECKSQIDHILITKNGIFNIETKNYSGIISINSNGDWIQTIRNRDRRIDNATKQSLVHENTLNRITKSNYKIHNLIVIANKFTEISMDQNSTVPIVRIDNLKEYIENIEMVEGKYNINEIAESIINYKIAFIKKAYKNMRYFVKDNSIAITALVMVFLMDRAIVNQVPQNILHSNSAKVVEDQAPADSVFNINEKLNLKEINSIINITNITKTKNEVIVDLVLENNNSKKELKLLDFTFSLATDNDIVYDDILLPYRSNKFDINPKEKIVLTARFEHYDNISELNDFVVKYDNSNVKFEKKLAVLLKDNTSTSDVKILNKEFKQ